VELNNNLSIEEQRRFAAKCTDCPLYKNASQTVYGEGPETARIMIVGEQPGDKEDLAGRPFIGPAGKLLDLTLEATGISRSEAYITNAVKHFKWKPSPGGKYRQSVKPTTGEIEACRQWFDRELEAIQPSIILCLGAAAAQSVLGKTFSISRQHGQLIPPAQGRHSYVMVTWHPSAILRSLNKEDREQKKREFLEDFSKVSKLLQKIRHQKAPLVRLKRVA
jgi:uracil-DNA glycosylase